MIIALGEVRDRRIGCRFQWKERVTYVPGPELPLHETGLGFWRALKQGETCSRHVDSLVLSGPFFARHLSDFLFSPSHHLAICQSGQILVCS